MRHIFKLRDSLKGKRGERKRENMKISVGTSWQQGLDESCSDKWKRRVNKLIFDQWSPPPPPNILIIIYHYYRIKNANCYEVVNFMCIWGILWRGRMHVDIDFSIYLP